MAARRVRMLIKTAKRDGGKCLMSSLRVRLLVGCALAPFLVAFVGTVTGSASPFTFWWYATAAEHIPAAREALECALSRIRAATCLPVDVSFDAHHWVRIRPVADMAVYGHTGGSSWASTRISIREDASVPCNTLVHEIGHHLLRRRNDHVAPAQPSTGLHEALLTEICNRHDCRCFTPETTNEVPP
jgi:hypothetical protein